MNSHADATASGLKNELAKQSQFFKDFDGTMTKEILSHMQECSFDREHIIFSKDDDSDFLYLIADGEIEISMSSKDGKTIVLAFMSRGDVFGEIGLLDKSTRSATATARTDVTLYKLSCHDFQKLAVKFGQKEWNAMTVYICGLFRRVTNNMEETAFLDKDTRLLRKILEMYEHNPKRLWSDTNFEIDISQELLGRMVGLSREATNKALSRLSKNGLIINKYKHIFIPNIKTLRQFIQKADRE